MECAGRGGVGVGRRCVGMRQGKDNVCIGGKADGMIRRRARRDCECAGWGERGELLSGDDDGWLCVDC